MAYLIVESGSNQGQQFEIHDEAVIGRHSSCDIVLAAAGMSRRQCRLFEDGGCYVVEDMKSRNGTFVNGEQVRGTRRLATNDIVNVSHYMLRFIEHESTTEETTYAGSFILDDNRSLGTSISMDASYYSALSGQDEDGNFDPTTLDRLASSEIELQKRLDIFYQVAQALTSASEDKELLHEVIECLFTVFPQADRAFVMTGQHLDDMQISYVKTRDEKRESIGEITVSRTVLEDVLTKREALLVADMDSDVHYGQAVSIIAQEINSVMCVPMICQDEIFGVVQIENFSISDPFEGKDLNMLVGIAVQAALFLRNAKLMRDVAVEANRRSQLQRFFSPTVARQVMNEDVQLGGELREGCVMFCDIVGFTSLSEKVGAREVIKCLNEYFGVMVSIILDEQGTVDKFGGDAIMAVWGAPLAIEGDTGHALACALRMQNAIVAFNRNIIDHGVQPFVMGVGLHSGEFIAGNIGSEDRMEYTVIGDHVNIAKRVESKATGNMLMISESFLQRNQGLHVWGAGFNPIRLKGKSEAYSLLCVRGIQDDDQFLLSIPGFIDGKFGKICAADADCQKFFFETVKGEMSAGPAEFRLDTTEWPDDRTWPIELTDVSCQLYTFTFATVPDYIAAMRDTGIVQTGRDIDWKR